VLIRFRSLAFVLTSISLIAVTTHSSSQSSRRSSGPSIFDERPHPMSCSDRPIPLPLGEHRYMAISPQARYARTRLQTISLPMAEAPALTIAAQPVNQIQIAPAAEDRWVLRYCMMGEGDTVEEAARYLQRMSIERKGSLFTLGNTDPRGLVGGKGTLHVDAPAESPVTVHSGGGVRVYDLTAPVRISAGMAEIINTTGLVDASASEIFFGGSQGPVTLNASWDIHIKITSKQFRGELRANAMREVRVLFPPGFQTPLSVVVSQSKDFVCHADFCSKMQRGRENSLYVSTYGNLAGAPDRINLRSENAHVTFDTVQ
jgi:hypothetical protein